MYRRKRKHRHEDMLEKERIPRSTVRSHEKSSNQLDPVAVQQARLAPTALKQEDVQQLQRAVGNKVIKRMLDRDTHPSTQAVQQGSEKLLQRAQVDIEQHEREEFTPVARHVTTSGDVNQGFGFTFPMEITQFEPNLQCKIWTFVGLKADQKDVDKEPTTLENWEAKIMGLTSMGIKGDYYSEEAVRAHEEVHRKSFLAITDAKEAEIKKHSSQPSVALEYWRSFCDAQGKKDHDSGATDNAELDIILKKIEEIWREARNLIPGPVESKKISVESQYQKGRKFIIFGKEENLLLAEVTLKPDGTIER